MVNLYNLEADPFENNNIANDNPQIVQEMEDILSNFTSYNTKESIEQTSEEDEIDDEELKEIQEELKKHGYI